MNDNPVLSTWNDLWCAEVPEEKLQKVMGAGKGNSWADSIWSIRAWRHWDICNSSQHYWKTSETAMGCISAALNISKTYENIWKPLTARLNGLNSSSWVNEWSKISVFSNRQGRQRSWRLATVHQGDCPRSVALGSLMLEHVFREKKNPMRQDKIPRWSDEMIVFSKTWWN